MATHGDDWTPSEEQTLETNWDTHSAQEIADMLPGRTVDAVYSKHNRMKDGGETTSISSPQERQGRYPEPVEDVGEVYWRENRRSSMRSGFLPVELENGKEIEVPVKNVDVVDVPGGLDAHAVFVFEKDIFVDYGERDGVEYEMRYDPRQDQWDVSSVPTDEAGSYQSIIPTEDVLWGTLRD